MSQTKLRVGLLLDDTTVPAWAFEMVNLIQQSDYAEVSLLVVNQQQPSKINKTLVEKIRNNKSRIGYLAVRKTLELMYDKLVDRAASLPDANASRNLFECVPVDTVRVDVQPIMKQHSDYFHEGSLNEIKKQQIDVFIRLGFRILRGGILSAAKYGVWSFHHGDNTYNRGGPAGYWESMQNWPETGSILQILSEDLDNGQVLYRSFSCTNKFSVKDNVNNYFWKSLYFVPRKLKELHQLGEQAFFAEVGQQNQYPQFYSNRLFLSPTNKELFKLVTNKLKDKFQHINYNRKYFDQWLLKFDFRDGISSSFWRYKTIQPPTDRFWADPHIICRDGRYFVFIEEYLYQTHKGHISVMEIKEDGTYSTPETVLETDYHLSYPFVFEHQGETYMIPESIENRTVELYKCVEFPNKWQFVKNLMSDVALLDVTLHHQDGKWWMFANGVENSGMSTWDELYLFFTDDFISGEWQAHSKNPIVSDCKRARPAGPLFMQNGQLIRPSQNCSHRYGYGFNLNVVEKLTETEYVESTVTEVTPDWSPELLATHTFCSAGRLSVIDAQITRKKSDDKKEI